MRLRLDTWVERARASLFVVPMLFALAGVGLGAAMLILDRSLDGNNASIPLVLVSTVESARSALSTIAAATIGFAGIAFSISLLVIQLGSSQYSPRVVHTLFRDPFNKRVMGLVVGTFTYCLIVLRSVRSPLEQSGTAVIPNLSVVLAVVLGVTAILATVAFINHSAHSMDISEILERTAHSSIVTVRSTWREPSATREPERSVQSEGDGHTVRFSDDGWVQLVDQRELIDCAPPGATVVLHTIAGRYAFRGMPLCTITPAPEKPENIDRHARSAVALGDTRTMQQDPSYGLRLLVDVALKALSPGINDPTTAQDAIFHAGAVLIEFLQRNPPPSVVVRDDGRQLVVAQQSTHAEIVGLAFDEVRRVAAPHPTVCVYLLEALEILYESLDDAGLHDRLPLLAEQARLVVDGCAGAGSLPHDVAIVRAAYEKRFGRDD